MSLLGSFSSFLSDQKSRLQNVYEVETTAIKNSNVISGIVQASNPVAGFLLPNIKTSDKVVGNTVASAIANNPATSAAIIATAGSSAGRSAVIEGVQSLPTKVKVGGALALPFIAGVIGSTPQKAATTVIEAPSNLNNFGKNVGNFASNPSTDSAKTVFTENPLLATGTAVGAGTLVFGSLGSLANLYATSKNTQSINDNTKSMLPTAPGTGFSNPAPNDHAEDIAKAQAKSAADIAQTNAKAQIEVAKIQAQQNQDTLNAQLKALQLQSASASAAPTTPVAPVKKTAKKKASKKKPKKAVKKKKSARKKTAKRKTYKRKPSKRKK